MYNLQEQLIIYISRYLRCIQQSTNVHVKFCSKFMVIQCASSVFKIAPMGKFQLKQPNNKLIIIDIAYFSVYCTADCVLFSSVCQRLCIVQLACQIFYIRCRLLDIAYCSASPGDYILINSYRDYVIVRHKYYRLYILQFKLHGIFECLVETSRDLYCLVYPQENLYC